MSNNMRLMLRKILKPKKTDISLVMGLTYLGNIFINFPEELRDLGENSDVLNKQFNFMVYYIYYNCVNNDFINNYNII